MLMYVIYIKNNMQYLLNESKILIFVYNDDQKVYIYIYRERETINCPREHSSVGMDNA